MKLFGRGFDSAKCKKAAEMTVLRIEQLRQKKKVTVDEMRLDIAMLLKSGQDATACVRVERVIREENNLLAYEYIELFCESILERLQLISEQREIPRAVKEDIASVIFAAPRCSPEIPELNDLRSVFAKKYGKDFVEAAASNDAYGGVNRMLINKLSRRISSGETKLKVMKQIAREYHIDQWWDPTESQMELLLLNNNNNNPADQYQYHQGEEKIIVQDNNFDLQQQPVVGHVEPIIKKQHQQTTSHVSSSSSETDLQKTTTLRTVISAASYIKFDESEDSEDEEEEKIEILLDYNNKFGPTDQTIMPNYNWSSPKKRSELPRHVHPKLPDYDHLVAHFTSLKGSESNFYF